MGLRSRGKLYLCSAWERNENANSEKENGMDYLEGSLPDADGELEE